MNVNPTEAERALAAIRETESQMNKTMSSSGGSVQIIVWGIVMMIGYTLNQFADRLPVALVAGSWIVMSILANILSVTISVRRARKFHSPYGARLGFLWVVFLLFGGVGAFFVHPSDPREINLLVYLLTMLWMAAMGLWVDLRLLWVSLTFTALMLFGYLVLPDYFFLWLAIVGGGAMIGSGLLLLRGRA
ncbi:MAG: hypothetical protein JW748_04805 [Anaerolineales bacterium]|nr:hypothetical protein [Anaerolineales bacterium]